MEKKETTTQTTETVVGTVNGSSSAAERNSEAASGMGSTERDAVEDTIHVQGADIKGPRADDLVKQENISEGSAPPEPVTKENVRPGLANATLIKQDDSLMHPPTQQLIQQGNRIAVNSKSIDAASNAIASDTVLESSRPESVRLKPEPTSSVSQWQSYAAKPPDFQVRQLSPPYDKHIDTVVAFAGRCRSHELFLSFGYCQRYPGSFQPRHQQPSSEG